MSQPLRPPISQIKERQIQRLCQKSGCSRDVSMQALNQQQGSLLSAYLSLEAEGLIPPPEHPNAGFFSTKDMGILPDFPQISVDNTQDHWSIPSFLHTIKSEIFQNNFELWYHNRYRCKIPVAMLLLLFPLTYGSLVLLLSLPLFFGVHYRFSSEGSLLSEFNPIVKRISNSLSKLPHIFKKKPKH